MQRLEAVALVVSELSKSHGLKLNFSKCSAILFGSKYYIKQFNSLNVQFLKVGNNIILFVANIKNPGITFMQNLSWEDNLNQTISKVYRILGRLRYRGEMLTPKVKVMLVRALVIPLIA